MSELLLFAVIGLGLGAVYAIVGTSVVLTYKGTGSINIAATAMALPSVFAYDELRREGKLALPLPFISEFEVGKPPAVVAIAIALAIAGLVGALMHALVARRLSAAPVLAKVVASVGVMVVMQAITGIRFGTRGRLRPPLMPSENVGILGEAVPIAGLFLALAAVVLGGAVVLGLQTTRAGLAIQAASEDEAAAALAGLSPGRLAMWTWVLSTVLTAFGLIIAGPVTGVLTPQGITLLVVPCLAAALIGRLTSVVFAVVGGLVVGMAQSVLTYWSNTTEWWPEWGKSKISDALPFVLIVGMLFLLGRGIPTRGESISVRMPPAVIPRLRPWTVVAWTAVGLVAILATSGSYRYAVITSLAMSLLALSLVVLTGFVGQISLAQAAFAGTSAFALAKIGTSVPFPASMILAVALAVGAGILTALPALRIRGAQLAVVTLAAGVAVQSFIFGNTALLNPSEDRIPSVRLFGISFAVSEGRNVARVSFGILVLLFVVALFVLVGNILRGTTGSRFLAVRSNERSAASLGINVAAVKVSAFALAALLAGISGALIGYSRGLPSADSFGVFVSINVLAIAYLGGITSLGGAAVAGVLAPLGFVYVVLRTQWDFGMYYDLFAGVSLIVTVLLNPVGIVGKLLSDLDKARSRWSRRSAVAEATVTVAETAHATSAPRSRSVGEVVLSARGVTVEFGGLAAVRNVDISVRSGEIVGLIGPNGAGKTTLIDALTGFNRARGEIKLHGRRIDGTDAHKRARHGLARTWQSLELFDSLSARGNVLVAAQADRRFQMLRDAIRPTRSVGAAVDQALELTGLSAEADRRTGELSLGRQKALSLARALAMSDHGVLLMDEPAAGLDSWESAQFGATVKAIAETGVACLLVDHDMQLVLGICDRVYVLNFGEVIAMGHPDEITRNPAVIEAYLGTSQDAEEDPAGSNRTPLAGATS